MTFAHAPLDPELAESFLGIFYSFSVPFSVRDRKRRKKWIEREGDHDQAMQRSIPSDSCRRQDEKNKSYTKSVK